LADASSLETLDESHKRQHQQRQVRILQPEARADAASLRYHATF
jgi:hypothetical protein